MSEWTVEIDKLVKLYPSFTLGPVTMRVPKGGIYGLIGPNGAGKTTTFNLIMGLTLPDAGTIRVFGLDHLHEEVRVKAGIGFVSPHLDFGMWGRVGRVLSFFGSFYPDWDDDYCRQLLVRLRVNETDRVSELSFGAKIKLNLILALAHRPPLLLLDEPLAGLDAPSRHEVFSELLDAVKDADRTVLISSHDIHDLERFCDHIGILLEGKLTLDGPVVDVVGRFRMLDCVADDGLADAHDAHLRVRNIPGVARADYVQDRWRILFDRTAGRVEELAQNGLAVAAESPLTLEEILVALEPK